MENSYKSGNSVPQILVAIVATVLLGSVALVGTVGPANASPLQIATQTHG